MPSTHHARAWTWGAVLLLLIFWFSRLHNLLALPIFLDEASHITRAQWVWQGKPLYLLETGKALAPYLAAVFWPFAGAPFIGRFVVVLIGAVGLASVYVVGRELHSRQAGLLAMALWIICPQLMFFERMALVDTTISSMAMLTLWLAIRMIRSGSDRWALVCGIGLALGVLAKTTGIVYLPIPVLVAVLVRTRIAWKTRVRLIGISYLVALLILIGPIIYARSVEADPTGVAYGLTTTDVESLPARAASNAAQILHAEQVYFSPVMLWGIIICAFLLVFLLPDTALLLLVLIAAPLAAVIAAAASLWLRYASPAAPFMLLLTAVSLVAVADRLRQRNLPRLVYALPWLVAALWAILVGIPFHLTAYNDPAHLELPDGDMVEYIQWIPSGYGIRDAAHYLQGLSVKPITVIGTAVNCHAARLYMPLDTQVKFICPDLDWGGGNWKVVYQIQEQVDQAGYVYVLGEEAPIVNEYQLPDPHIVVKEFGRPGGDYTVKLYRIGNGSPAATIP